MSERATEDVWREIADNQREIAMMRGEVDQAVVRSGRRMGPTVVVLMLIIMAVALRMYIEQ